MWHDFIFIPSPWVALHRLPVDWVRETELRNDPQLILRLPHELEAPLQLCQTIIIILMSRYWLWKQSIINDKRDLVLHFLVGRFNGQNVCTMRSSSNDWILHFPQCSSFEKNLLFVLHPLISQIPWSVKSVDKNWGFRDLIYGNPYELISILWNDLFHFFCLDEASWEAQSRLWGFMNATLAHHLSSLLCPSPSAGLSPSLPLSVILQLLN